MIGKTKSFFYRLKSKVDEEKLRGLPICEKDSIAKFVKTTGDKK